jgi:hypothetical protein
LCCCYYCDQGTLTSGQGCASWVTGYGLNNFCADGGDPNPANWLYNAVRGGSGGTAGYCIIQNNSNCGRISTIGGYGLCMCGNGNFCENPGGCLNSGNDLFCQPTVSSRNGYGNLTIPATRGCHFVITAPGMFAATKSASTGQIYMYFSAPPIVNVSPDARYADICNGCYIATTVGACDPTAFPMPNRGGISNHANGGQMTYGLPGGGGQVCIYWL